MSTLHSFAQFCALITSSGKIQNQTNFGFQIVMCEYSKFRIESNSISYFSMRFDSKRAQLFEIFEYLPSPIWLNVHGW